jgi:5,10-methylenetetrahydrofolate reductase
MKDLSTGVSTVTCVAGKMGQRAITSVCARTLEGDEGLMTICEVMSCMTTP